MVISGLCLRLLENPDPDSASGYHCVYRKGAGWHGKVFRRAVGPIRGTPIQAARDVAEFWAYWFGDRWQEFFAARKVNAFKFVKGPKGVRILVFLLGKPFYLTRKGKPTNEPSKAWHYENEVIARRRLQWWMRERYGIFEELSGLEMRRAFKSKQIAQEGRERRRVWQAPQVPHLN